MAQAYLTDAGALITPGAYARYTVQQSASGLATTGVLMLVGEADAGPDFTLEKELQKNVFGPDQIGAVVAKYKSGPLVDAFKTASQPSADPGIPGAPSGFILVKTNPSTKASGALTRWDASAYGIIRDRSYGALGNLIFVGVTAKTSEVVPTTGAFTFIPPVGTVDVAVRANGGAAGSVPVTAAMTPTAFQAAVDALSGVGASGGALRTVLPSVTGNVSVTVVSGNTIRLDYTSTFTTIPSVGDTFVIPTGSPVAGVDSDGAGADLADENIGAYVVTAATSNSITATKLSDAGRAGAVAGTVRAPIAVSATPVTATTNIAVYAPVTISLDAGSPVPGVGKSLEIHDVGTGTDQLVRIAYALSTTPATWPSRTAAPKLITSASEYRARLTASRQADGISDDLEAGGDIGLRLGYVGTSASLVIDKAADTFVVTVVGGTGASLSLKLSSFPTISDLVAYINTQTGYSAAAGSIALGARPATALDSGTFTCGTSSGNQTCRVKLDAYSLAKKVAEQSALVEFAAEPTAGLPAPIAAFPLLGGTKGGTTNATIQAALDALTRVRGNFLVPLFSRDASLDAGDLLTETSSTYTIDAIHAMARTHVLDMSKIKRRRNRQAFLSYRGTFANSKDKAGMMASPKVSMSFLDKRVVDSTGSIKQFHPWMDAVLAAGMQAAGFYRPLFRKFLNIVGSLHADGSFSDQDDTQVEEALVAGLLPVRQHENGGFYYVSDQTTYSKDSNFVYNSIQAMYVADTIALTSARLMEDAFVGQSTADVSAQVAMTYFESVMENFLRLKLIASSQGAERGFRNAKIEIKGPAMVVECEVKLAGAIYFVPIAFLVSMVEQSATA